VRELRGTPGVAPGFVVAYAIAAGLGLPGSVFTLAGGALFGTLLGTLLNWIGATIGATIAYLIARSLGRDAVRKLLGKHAGALDRAVADGGFANLLRLRLIPIVPFNALNFGAGLAGVPLRSYVLATALGILPGTAVYTFFADALLSGAAGARQDALVRVGIAGGLLVLLSFVPALARRLGWVGPAAALTVAVTVADAPTAAAQPAARTAAVDHAAFDQLLRRHVVNGMVDYDAFARSAEFKQYLATLAATNPAALPRDEQLALWMNAYNAYTIQLINKHNERKSIRNINKTFGIKAYGPWKEKLANVGGRAYGLDEIEQDILRKQFEEPRIHFALVCAAMGCPPLRGEAYVASRLDEQLDDQGRNFLLRSPTKNRVDVAARAVYLSPIFVEFRDYIKDFGGSNPAVGKYVAKYFPAGPERTLLESGAFKVVVTDYDWTLNSQENARRLAQGSTGP